MGKLGVSRVEIVIAMSRGVYDCLTILPNIEFVERVVIFVQIMIIEMISSYCGENKPTVQE